jgi:hypothetical protein
MRRTPSDAGAPCACCSGIVPLAIALREADFLPALVGVVSEYCAMVSSLPYPGLLPPSDNDFCRP